MTTKYKHSWRLVEDDQWGNEAYWCHFCGCLKRSFEGEVSFFKPCRYAVRNYPFGMPLTEEPPCKAHMHKPPRKKK